MDTFFDILHIMWVALLFTGAWAIVDTLYSIRTDLKAVRKSSDDIVVILRATYLAAENERNRKFVDNSVYRKPQ